LQKNRLFGSLNGDGDEPGTTVGGHNISSTSAAADAVEEVRAIFDSTSNHFNGASASPDRIMNVNQQKSSLGGGVTYSIGIRWNNN
jgi:hypothetical protein